MVSEKMAVELNKQLNFEIYSAYVYASMSSWLKSKDLAGFSNWMNVQVREEMDHAMRFYEFLHDSGASVEFDTVPKPKTEWADVNEVFEDTLAHERAVTSRIGKLIDLALEEKDHATNAALQWFISEQVEEESGVSAILKQVKRVNDFPNMLFMLDRELGQRAYTPPATSGA
ncbi:MAG: ferritin [Kiritimatiellaeota bacterium]|nr:ferritin [Kiritimatiellota bacterium]